MRSHRDNPYQNRLPLESPPILSNQITNESDFKQVSPIQPLLWSQTADPKRKLHFDGNEYQEENSLDISPPVTLAKEFYRDPTRHIDANKQQNRRQNQGISPTSNKITASLKDFKQTLREPGQHYSEYDQTANEITSSKRFYKMKAKPNVEGSAIGCKAVEQVSSADEEKWAFSNQDSLEPQNKKGDVNYQMLTAQALLSRSLKSHDSQRSGTYNHQTLSSQDPEVIRGKVLEFSGLGAAAKRDSKLPSTDIEKIQNKLLQVSDGSGVEDSENQIISFLDGNSDSENDFRSSGKRCVTNLGNYDSLRPSMTRINGLKYQKQKLTEALQSLIENSVDCALCHDQQIFHSSLQCSVLEGHKDRQKIINENLERKYLTSREYYNVKLINDIIYNENTNIVSVFKDYLIFDDVSEFLKRFYKKQEAVQRLPSMFEFYEQFSKVFPNYVVLPENKYMFKNIERKQRLYDDKQRILLEQEERKQIKTEKNGADFKLGNSAGKGQSRHRDRFSQSNQSSFVSQLSGNKMFSSTFINSVANIQPSGVIDQSSVTSSRINNSQFQDHKQNSSVLIQQQLRDNKDKAQKKKAKRIDQLSMDQLIDKFIIEDSESPIQASFLQSNNKQQPEATTDKEQHLVQSSLSLTPSDSKLNPRPHLIQMKSDNKRQSTGSYKAQDSCGKSNPLKKPSPDLENNQPQQHQTIKEKGKVLNYNICNNYNHFINNENYYISAHKPAKSPTHASEKSSDQPMTAQTSRRSSLKRSKSRGNLHGVAHADKSKVTSNPSVKCLTPPKQEASTPITSPTSAKQKKQKIIVKQDKGLLINQRDQQKHLNVQPVLSKFSNSKLKQSRDLTASPRGLQQCSNNVHGGFLQGRASEELPTTRLASKDLSKERVLKHPPPLPFARQEPQPNLGNNKNKVFKNEQNLKTVQVQDESQKRRTTGEPEFNVRVPQSKQIHSSTARSVERLKGIEEEIEKDYSKYVNEYGLTKTAFAKAVNALREKQLLEQQQQIMQTARAARTSQGSNEKAKRPLSSHLVGDQTSLVRKQGKYRQDKAQQLQEVETPTMKNTIALKIDHQNPIKSVRAKTHLNSHNNSNFFLKSQKFSPDRKTHLGNFQNQGIATSNVLLSNPPSTHYQQSQPSSNVIAMKGQPCATAKGLKIKFPLNSKKGTKQLINHGSLNHTPQRIKLSKTKSTSNIASCGLLKQQAAIASNIANQRGRVNDMMTLDEMSNQFSGTQFLSTSYKSGMNSQIKLGSTQPMQGVNDFYVTPQENTINQALFPQRSYASNVGGITNTTSSILNSPSSNKAALSAVTYQDKSKVRGSSRNNGCSQNQSYKSNGVHQRASSTSNNRIYGSNNKINAKPSKRLSAGSNLSKKPSQPKLKHQPSQSNVQQHILQLLMAYQTEGESNNLGNGQQGFPMSKTLKSLQNPGNNSASVKDLRARLMESAPHHESMAFDTNQTSNCNQSCPQAQLRNVKQVTGTLLKDMKALNGQKQRQTTQGAFIQQEQKGISTQRLGPTYSSLAGSNSRKSSKSGKNTSRGDSKRRSQPVSSVLPCYPYDVPSSVVSQHSGNYKGTNKEVSSRIAAALASGENSSFGAKNYKKGAKNPENIDLIKMAAQRAAQEQFLQQQRTSVSGSLNQPKKFLQNLKQQDNCQMLNKFKLAPSSSQNQPALQSARNSQHQLNQFKGDFDHSCQTARGPHNIILSQNFDKPSSRRTSGKFNPSSTKNQ